MSNEMSMRCTNLLRCQKRRLKNKYNEKYTDGLNIFRYTFFGFFLITLLLTNHAACDYLFSKWYVLIVQNFSSINIDLYAALFLI